MKKEFNKLCNIKFSKNSLALLAGILIFFSCIYLLQVIETNNTYPFFLTFLLTFSLTFLLIGFGIIAFHFFKRIVLKPKKIIFPNDKKFLKSFLDLFAGFLSFIICIYLENIIKTSFDYPFISTIFLTLLLVLFLTGSGIVAFYVFDRIVLKPKRIFFLNNDKFLKSFVALLTGLLSLLLSIFLMKTVIKDLYFPAYMMFVLTGIGTIAFYCFNSLVLKSKRILFPTLLFSPLLFYTLIFLILEFRDVMEKLERRALERQKSFKEDVIQEEKTYTGDTCAIKAIGNICNRIILEDLQWVNGRVTSLSVDSKNIDTIPQHIGMLDSLVYLSFSENYINSVPAEIGKLTHLERLYLRNNYITVIPEQLWDLSSLTVLDLSTNHLTELSPQIGNLSNLKILDLRNNQLKRIPREIGLLTNLEILDLSYNQLDSLPVEIMQCTKLKRLYLNNNKMKALPNEIATLSKTCSLQVNNNFLCRKNLQPEMIQWLEARNIEWETLSGQK
jgi:Leucine-rich repeat (LRR) protein